MSDGRARVSPRWLRLREPSDAAARSGDLVRLVRGWLPAGRPLLGCDLACGTGAMVRWLAPQIAGAQHWILCDVAPDLLEAAAAHPPVTAADGSTITVETRHRDITRLAAGELRGVSLITASALLDMLSADELDRLVATCVQPGCPVLVTISVTGRVELVPPDPLDEHLAAAFNDHQRRTVDGSPLLGPDAVGVATDSFARHGAAVEIRPSAWHLGAGDVHLATEWLSGWVGAACEQRPELTAEGTAYLGRRHADAASGRLRVAVHHHDLLAWPTTASPPAGRAPGVARG